MVWALLHGALVALADLPDVIDCRDRDVVMSHKIVLPDKEVQFNRLDLVFNGIEQDGVHHDIQVAAPVIQLGRMVFLERVVDGERMKVKPVAQDGFSLLIRGALKIDPYHPMRIVQCDLKVDQIEIGMEFSVWRKM